MCPTQIPSAITYNLPRCYAYVAVRWTDVCQCWECHCCRFCWQAGAGVRVVLGADQHRVGHHAADGGRGEGRRHAPLPAAAALATPAGLRAGRLGAGWVWVADLWMILIWIMNWIRIKWFLLESWIESNHIFHNRLNHKMNRFIFLKTWLNHELNRIHSKKTLNQINWPNKNLVTGDPHAHYY